jgi:radial spoke head protein 9
MTLDYTKTVHGFPAKKFYWCSSSNFVFASLPEAIIKYADRFNSMNTFLSGEFDRILIANVTAPVVVDEYAGIIIPGKNITELDRLSHVVRSIESNCQVVPKRSYKYTPIHEVLKNEAFKGLSIEEAFELSNWQHFRVIEQPEKLGLI